MTAPRIGLALGSGAGRGWAHIGVLRALERAGVQVDVVAGTSVGALVGGVWLAGHLDMLEQWALGLNRMRILRYLDVVLGGGLIAGDRLRRVLSENLGDAQIEGLPKRFVAVATELLTGHEIWLRNGPLVDGVRASYALPGVFKPVDIDNRWLVDGALVNPVPVSVCRAYGARLVIAVNLNADMMGRGQRSEEMNVGYDLFAHAGRLAKAAKLEDDTGVLKQLGKKGPEPGLFNVMVNSLNILQDRVARARLAGDPPDVTIAPRVGNISLLEFDRAQEAIDEGEAAVERSLPFLREAMAVLAS
ncbi:MAG: patatin-like phospholipase family protein [Alphaproteobacteria bacterium]